MPRFRKLPVEVEAVQFMGAFDLLAEPWRSLLRPRDPGDETPQQGAK